MMWFIYTFMYYNCIEDSSLEFSSVMSFENKKDDMIYILCGKKWKCESNTESQFSVNQAKKKNQ